MLREDYFAQCCLFLTIAQLISSDFSEKLSAINQAHLAYYLTRENGCLKKWTGCPRTLPQFALAAQTAAGHDPLRSVAVSRARGEAISEGHRRNRSWAPEHTGGDEARCKREIAPKLGAFTLAEIAAVTGLSLAICSCIRAASRCHIRGTGALCRGS